MKQVILYPDTPFAGANKINNNFTELYDAYSGYSGASGRSGYSGQSGLSGFTGYSAYSGKIATSSKSGYTGTSGYSAFSGISGYSGYSGASGYSSSGFSGSSGYLGTSGYSGYSGISGYSGTSGYSAFSGISGYSGYSGSGYSGYSGTSGYSGIRMITIGSCSNPDGLNHGLYRWTTFAGGLNSAAGLDVLHLILPSYTYNISNLYVRARVNSLDSTAIVTVQDTNGNPTALSVVLASGVISGSDLVHSVTYTAGQAVSVIIDTHASGVGSIADLIISALITIN